MDEEDQAPIHSVDDLDKRIESDRRVAAILFESSYSEQVIAGIKAISEINQIANARIQTDTRVAAARIASQAEVTCIELLSTAELTALKIYQLKDGTSNAIKIDKKKIISANGNEALLEIEKGCSQSIEDIKKYGDIALTQISENMDSATAKIQSHVAEVKSQVEKNEVIANDKLKKSKTEERTYKTAENDGEKAKVKFAAFAKEAANQLFKMSSYAIADINKMSQSALEEISTVVMKAETKIKKTKDFALSHLRHILD